jgi:dUTP diphosphatase
MSVPVKFQRLAHGAGLPLPEYQSEEAAGIDLTAAIDDAVPMILAPGAYTMVPTAIAIALPPGFEAQVRPRSGLAARHGVTVLNSPGTIDSDYRGEIKVLLINHGDSTYEITRGARIAQLVIAPVTRAEFNQVASLDTTERGSGGFGSTGTH